MTHFDIWLVVLVAVWLGFGFMAWGFQDGYLTWKHPQQRKVPVDPGIIIFDVAAGPVAAIVTFFVFGFGNWTRRFWSKSQKEGWDMLEKLEYYTD
jgi:hypothetical protein